MSDSPESVVRKFLACQESFKPHEMASFSADDGVYVDSAQGVEARGVEAIRSELHRQAGLGFDNVTIEVKSLVADGGTVMMERVDSFTVGGKPFSGEVMAVFEIDADGRIKRWRDFHDLKSITDQMRAAGIPVPD